MKLIPAIGLFLASVAEISQAQTAIDLRSQTKHVDFSGAIATRPFRTGTALAPTCATGEVFFRLDTVPGQNVYLCTGTNLWTPLPGPGIFGNGSYDATLGLGPGGSLYETGWRSPAVLGSSVYFGLPGVVPSGKSVMVFDVPSFRVGNDPSVTSQVSDAGLYTLSGGGALVATIGPNASDGCAQISGGTIVSTGLPCFNSTANSNFSQQAATPVLDFGTLRIQEYFCGGPGSLPWTASELSEHVSTYHGGSDSNYPCYELITTGSFSQDGASLHPRSSGGTVFEYPYGDPGNGRNWQFDLLIQLAGSNDLAFEFGLNRGAAPFTTDDAIRIRYDTGQLDSHWTFESCSSAHCTTTASSVSPSPNVSYQLRIARTADGISCSINGEPPAIVSSDVPTTSLVPTISIRTLTSTPNTVKLIAGGVEISGIVP